MGTSGRPSKYSKALADKICSLRASGRSMRAIGRMPDMPSAHTIYNWMLSNESFFQQYAQACEIDAEIEFDSLIELADQSTAKTAVADKLKIDTRKWVLSKRIPKKYGDKQQLEHSGPNGEAILVNVIFGGPDGGE